MPIVSVVIPVYNAEKYINKCLDSLLNQTLKNIEVICVNDGSKDSSLELLEQYAKKDSRIKVVSQNNQGAGPARNKGMELATGKYLSILDADDFFDPEMLEKTVKKAEKDNAEILVFEAWNYNDETEDITENDIIDYKEFLPKEKCFSRKDIPKYILNFTWGTVWNKLFLREFVEGHQLKFQAVRMVDDAYFVLMALVKAERISILEERLLFYRVNNPMSQLGMKDKTPTAFFDAYYALHTTLIKEGIFEEVEQSLVNRTLKMCIFNLNGLSTFESYSYLYNKLKEEYFEAFGYSKYDQDFFYDIDYYAKYKMIEKYSLAEYFYTNFMSVIRGIYGKFQQRYFKFPFDKIEKESNIILYGAGDVGNAYFRQVICSRHCYVRLWVDRQFESIGAPVSSPKLIKDTEFDYIIICVVDAEVEKSIRKYLLSIGVSEEKILWEEPVDWLDEEEVL